MQRIPLVAGAAAIGSWIALGLGAGNVGLQRSISSGAWTLFTERPLTVGLSLATATSISLGLGWLMRLAGRDALGLAAGIALMDAIAGLVLAPLAIGELGPIHAPLVFLSVSLAGLQVVVPAAAVAILGRLRPTADSPR
jgi:hypothetical protein